MKLIALGLSIALVGCASPPPAPPKPVQIPTQSVDARCFNYAKYARAVANLREMGMPRSGIPLTDANHTFPIYVVQDDVYAHPTISPVGMEARHLGFCIISGYDKLVENLNTDEYTRNERYQHDKRTAETVANVKQLMDTKVLRQASASPKKK